MSFKTQWIDKQDNVDDVRASDINSIAQELIRVNDEKIDESRVTKEFPDITETWGVNISGIAAYANVAHNDSEGHAITSYVNAIRRSTETQIDVDTWDTASKYQISATSQKYVDDKISEVTQKIKESYPYNVVDMSEYMRIISVYQNAVTYVYGGPTESGTIYFEILTSAGTGVSKEAVVILNLSSLTTAPTLQFENHIKWLNGEPPTIEAGKIYMFSFILTADFYLGIGGEFA